MMAWIRRLAWLLVDVVSKLETHQKTGHESEPDNPSYPEPIQLKLAIHYLGVSTRHFRSGGIFLRLPVKHFASSTLNSSKHLIVRGWRLCGEHPQSKE